MGIHKKALVHLIVLSLCVGIPTGSISQNKFPPGNYWLTESHALTSILIEDANSLDQLARILLWARMGEIWWEQDKGKSRSWLNKAVDELEQKPDQVSSDDPLYRRSVARILLSIVATKDSALSERLTTLLTSSIDNKLDPDNDKNAETLVRIALSVVDTNPQQAASLGAASLKFGRSGYFPSYLRKLYAKAPNLAGPLIDQALVIAFSKMDKFRFELLLHSAYPNNNSLTPSSKPALPDQVCAKILDAAIQFTRRADADTPLASCNFVLNNLISLINEYHRLLPQQATAITEMGLRCKAAMSNSTLGQIKAAETFDKQSLESIDDILAAAKNKADATQKIILTYRAIEKARQEKQIARAIEILDGMNENERQINISYWKSIRGELAASLAYENLKHWDLTSTRKAIDDTPADLRPIVLLQIAQLTANNQLQAGAKKDAKGDNLEDEGASTSFSKYQQVILNFLREAKSELPKAQLTNQEREQLYLVLIGLYTKLEQSEALPAFRDAITEINRFQNDQSKSATQLGHPKGEIKEVLQPMRLPIALIEENYQDISLIVSSAKDGHVRVKMRLGLLDSLLTLHSATDMKQSKESKRKIQ